MPVVAYDPNPRQHSYPYYWDPNPPRISPTTPPPPVSPPPPPHSDETCDMTPLLRPHAQTFSTSNAPSLPPKKLVKRPPSHVRTRTMSMLPEQIPKTSPNVLRKSNRRRSISCSTPSSSIADGKYVKVDQAGGVIDAKEVDTTVDEDNGGDAEQGHARRSTVDPVRDKSTSLSWKKEPRSSMTSIAPYRTRDESPAVAALGHVRSSTIRPSTAPKHEYRSVSRFHERFSILSSESVRSRSRR